LFPHVKVVESTGVEIKRYPPNPVEHYVRAGHVEDIGECPREFLGHSGTYIEEDLQYNDKDRMD
jgi:hypothetical protein